MKDLTKDYVKLRNFFIYGKIQIFIRDFKTIYF
ncbi:MAG: hypothetical protein UV95_C0002G0044 [Candidatus Falkowbacteria bacterium GW2011_GWF2_43_32]|nr:MAG: hypothetical protein UV95_C0002G0044 [Candidatus Falkowbacteria bacterium GW2011_GWF2_43_32]